ncbi:MAG: hypothetical protein WAK95_07040 [Desulfobacterales bacterium]
MPNVPFRGTDAILAAGSGCWKGGAGERTDVKKKLTCHQGSANMAYHQFKMFYFKYFKLYIHFGLFRNRTLSADEVKGWARGLSSSMMTGIIWT